MTRVTSKLQVTVPKSVADRYGIEPGSEIDWLPAGEAIRVVPRGRDEAGRGGVERRLELFDHATDRQRSRQEGVAAERDRSQVAVADRGWRREDLYERGTGR